MDSQCQVCGQTEGLSHYVMGCPETQPGLAEAIQKERTVGTAMGKATAFWHEVSREGEAEEGHGEGGGSEAYQDGAPPKRRRRIRSKRPAKDVIELDEPHIEAKIAFPIGTIYEAVNGVRREDGSVRFPKKAVIYTDGSCQCPGTRFAVASAAVVCDSPDGSQITVQAALPAEWPQSAVAAEHYAILLATRVIERGTVDGEPHGPRSITIVADCKAVILAGRRPWRARSPKHIYAGCWLSPAVGCVGEFRKVDARKAQIDAVSEGWGDDWKGNDAADDRAKAARPHVVGHHRAWARSKKRGREAMEEVAGWLEDWPWVRAHGVRRARARAAERPKAGPGHEPELVNGTWACRKCGLRFVNWGTALAGARRPCFETVKVDSQIHPSHDTTAGTMVGDGAKLVEGHKVYICVKCGHYAASQVVKLRQPCGADAGCKKRQLRNVAAGFHPEGRRRGALVRIVHLGDAATRAAAVGVVEAQGELAAEADDFDREAACREAEKARGMAAAMDPALWEDDGEPPAGVTQAASCLEADEEEDPFGHGEDFSWSPPPRRALMEAENAGCEDGGATCREVGTTGDSG